jgi:hypothetical protein
LELCGVAFFHHNCGATHYSNTKHEEGSCLYHDVDGSYVIIFDQTAESGWFCVRNARNSHKMRRFGQGYLTKIRESPKLVIKKAPIKPDSPLAKCCFEAHQIRVIQTHLNSPESPNLVVWVTRITKYLVIWVTRRKPKKPNLAINLEVK